MKKNGNKKVLAILLIPVILAAAAGITAYALSNYGTQEDPLITKSYLDQVLEPELLRSVDEKIAASTAAGEPGVFRPVSLMQGKVLYLYTGSEALLRSGEAVAGSGLADTTDGLPLESGSTLLPNHLLLCTQDGVEIRAETDALVMVSGNYAVIIPE